MVAGLIAVVALMATASGVGAHYVFVVRGGGHSSAHLECPGGMSQLGHVLDVDAPIFDGDPVPEVEVWNTIAEDFFLLERVNIGTHTSTHIDAPGHFIEGGRTVDQLSAEDFVWPARVIDVRHRMEHDGPDFQLSIADIKHYEEHYGVIESGSLVVIYTGFDELYGTDAFYDNAPGFSGEAVQWMFDERAIGAIGSDTFGPDATIDEDFLATYTALDNDGIVLPGLNNLESLNHRGDVVMAPAVRLVDGSGYQVNPLACHG